MVIKIIPDVSNKKSQQSFGVSYTKSTPNNLKKSAISIIEDSGSLDLAKAHIDRLVKLGKINDGLLGHVNKYAQISIKPANSKTKHFYTPTYDIYKDKGPNDWFAHEVDTLGFISSHPKFFKKAFDNSNSLKAKHKYTMEDFLNDPIVGTLLELPEKIGNKFGNIKALLKAKKVKVENLQIRYVEDNFSNGIPDVAVKGKNLPVKGYIPVLMHFDASLTPSYLKSKAFKKEVGIAVKQELDEINQSERIKWRAKSLAAYIDKVFSVDKK